MKRGDRKSTCPMNLFLELFGDPWTLLVVRDILIVGKSRPAQFLESDERISTNILADRLKRLEAADVVIRVPTGERNQVRYLPTLKAADALPVLFDMALWSMEHEPAAAPLPWVIDRIRTDRDGFLAEIRTSIANGLAAAGIDTPGRMDRLSG